jgi:acetyl-CoA carboxylase biotin carboxyl carrier protein
MPHNTPDINELRAIVDWVNLTEDVRELAIKFDGVELFISRDQQPSGSQPAVAHASAFAPVTQQSAAPAIAPATSAPADIPAPATSEQSSPDALAPDEVLIKAPMVGTYYASPRPGADAFVAVGDTVSADTVLCIVEVMKLMNNIEAQIDGTVTRIFAEDNQAVEYGQPLFVIKCVA